MKRCLTVEGSKGMSSARSANTIVTPQKYVPPPPPVKPADYEEFMAQLDAKERELHTMAEELLGSSYFVQWTHGYKKWKAGRK
jgi:hypothetical protein